MMANTRLRRFFSDHQQQLTDIRRDLHAHPEMAFEETRTSDIVAQYLRSLSIAVHTDIATTGVVGVLSKGEGPAIGLRADMDALPINELNKIEHCSTVPGVMHACGHDGHTTMLLGAAKYLAEFGEFTGTVYFIFQPAEEGAGGAKRMLDEGLLERFPLSAAYALHNWPGLEVGRFAARVGPQMAAFDTFEIVLSGTGAHAAMPHQGTDCIAAASHLISGLNHITSRSIDPTEASVLSVTQVHSGDSWNAIPDTAILRGSVRHFSDTVQKLIQGRIGSLAESMADAFGVTSELTYNSLFPATQNTREETAAATAAAAITVGTECVQTEFPPSLAAEDFGCVLEKVPGCYAWIGNGINDDAGLHNPNYDFNDEILPIGARYWCNLVESQLAK